MKTPSLIHLALATALVTPALAQDVTVKAAGMQLVWDSGSKDFNGFKTYNQEPGAGVALMVQSTKGKIIDIPNDGIQLTVGGVKTRGRFHNMSSNVSADGSKARLEVEAEGKVAFDAKGALPVEGKLSVLTASQKAEFKSGAIDFKANNKFVFPADAKLPELTIEKAGKASWGDGWEISLKTNASLDRIAGYKFVTKDGQTLAAKRTSSGSMSFLGKVDISVTLQTEKPVESGTLVAEVWTDQKKVDVPVSLKVGGQPN